MKLIKNALIYRASLPDAVALAEHLLPHGPAECQAAQLDIFNDSKESAA